MSIEDCKQPKILLRELRYANMRILHRQPPTYLSQGLPHIPLAAKENLSQSPDTVVFLVSGAFL